MQVSKREVKDLKRKTAILFATIVMILLFSISALAAKPKLSKKAVSLTVGKTKTLTLKNANKGTIKWTSSNKKIAVVKKKGKNKAVITAAKKGTATITAKYKGKKYKCKVTVKVDADFSWTLRSTDMKVVKIGEPFKIYIDTYFKDLGVNTPGHMFYIKIEDKSVLYGTDEYCKLTRSYKTGDFAFYPLKVGSTNVIFTCEGISKKVHVQVTGDNSEVYQAGLGKYLDSNGNFIESQCRKFEKTETNMPYIEGLINKTPGTEWHQYRELPLDGYHIGNCRITLDDIGGAFGQLPNGQIGEIMFADSSLLRAKLKLSLIDENGTETLLNVQDALFNATIESSDTQMGIRNCGKTFDITHPKTTTFSFGILHINYRGLKFDLPFGTTFE